GRVALDLRKGRREVVGVEECFAAGVGTECGQHLLRGEICIHVVGERPAVVSALAADAANGCVPERRDGFKSASIDGVDGEVSAYSGVHGSAQRSLILNTIARE